MTSGSQLKIKISKSRKKEILIAYLFLAPAIIGFLWFNLYPTLMSVYMSFFKWNVSMKHSFYGFGNYVYAFTKDPDFWTGVGTTLLYSVLAVAISLVLGFILAAMLNRPRKTTGLFRTIFYMPCMVAAGAPIMMVWQWILGGNGTVNTLLSKIGVQGPNWISAYPWTLVTCLIIGTWALGGMVIIFIAGLKGISVEYYESAEIDGAGYFQKTFKITIPMLSPIILYNVLISLITSLQTFTVVYLLRTNGANIKFWAVNIYDQAFRNGSYGYASAQASLLFVVVLLLSLLIFVTSGKWVFYGDES